MIESSSHDLSTAGQARRDHMLTELTAVMRRTHRSRRRRRQGAIALLSVIAVVALLRFDTLGMRQDRRPMMADAPRPGFTPLPSPGESVPQKTWVLVETDSQIVDRLRARPTGRVTILEDRALVDTLLAIGRPAGLIRADGRVRLTAAVTDAELDRRQ